MVIPVVKEFRLNLMVFDWSFTSCNVIGLKINEATK